MKMKPFLFVITPFIQGNLSCFPWLNVSLKNTWKCTLSIFVAVSPNFLLTYPLCSLSDKIQLCLNVNKMNKLTIFHWWPLKFCCLFKNIWFYLFIHSNWKRKPCFSTLMVFMNPHISTYWSMIEMLKLQLLVHNSRNGDKCNPRKLSASWSWAYQTPSKVSFYPLLLLLVPLCACMVITHNLRSIFSENCLSDHYGVLCICMCLYTYACVFI